jgi:hypothetical protein
MTEKAIQQLGPPLKEIPTTTGTFKQSQFINLEAYKTNTTYVAWVYESATSGGTDSARWTIDDVRISNEATFIASNPNLNFGVVLIPLLLVNRLYSWQVVLT